MPSNDGVIMVPLQDYLREIGTAGQQPVVDLSCEICGERSREVVRDTVEIARGVRTALSVVCCGACGFLYQTPRFNPDFYRKYYGSQYRQLLSGATAPSPEYVADQTERGEHLFYSLSRYLPERGRLLDVGCAAGGLMTAFVRHGWTALGVDPDIGCTAYGASVLRLSVVAQAAEDLEVEPAVYDLIIITGSLEHVYDPNEVLARCHRAAGPGSLLLLEGHALAQARQVGACGHNHRRYLTATAIELLMLKHGWSPLWITDEELCGPTRPQSVYGLGRRQQPVSPTALRGMIASGKRETPTAIRDQFELWGIA